MGKSFILLSPSNHFVLSLCYASPTFGHATKHGSRRTRAMHRKSWTPDKHACCHWRFEQIIIKKRSNHKFLSPINFYIPLICNQPLFMHINTLPIKFVRGSARWMAQNVPWNIPFCHCFLSALILQEAFVSSVHKTHLTPILIHVPHARKNLVVSSNTSLSNREIMTINSSLFFIHMLTLS